MQIHEFSKYLFLLLLAIYFVSPINAQSNKYIVTGKVVDESDKPIQNAYVTLDGRLSCEKWNGWEDIRNGTSTDENGDFRIESQQSLSSHIEFLYVASPTKGLNPFSPPFLNDCRAISFSSPYPVSLETDKEIDVGNLTVQIQYNSVTIYLIDKNNQPYFKEIDWKKVKLRYKDSQGRFMSEHTIDDEDFVDAIDTDLGSVTNSLPQGTWMIEILSAKRKPIKTAKIIVNKDSPTKIIIRL